MPFGSLPDTIFDTILGAFWGHFGEAWGVTLGKKRVQRGIEKMMRKTSLRVAEGGRGEPGGRPGSSLLNNHSSSLGDSISVISVIL